MINTIEIDVLVLGAGGGGYPAAFFLARAGLRVAMVDPIGNLGGDCLAEGCVPSKAVREGALARAMSRKYKMFGLSGAEPSVNWQGVLAHKDRVQNARYVQHTQEIANSTVIFHKGAGRVLGEHEAEVTTEAGQILHYRFRYLIAATGSRPHILPIPGAGLAITSHHLFRLGADLPMPARLAVIGGGYIGAESASMLDHLGVKTTIIETTAQLMPGADPDLRRYLTRILGRRIDLVLDASVTAIERHGSALQVRYHKGGADMTLDADAVLMATGRSSVRPEGIDAIGLAGPGPIAVDATMRSAIPHIYAPGDVNGRSMLFHSAVRQSMVAAHNILAGGQPVDRMNFHGVPFTVFTEPEVAWVGLDEPAAITAGLTVATTRYDYVTDSRAQIYDATDGFIKLVFDTSTSVLVGAQIAGMDAAQVVAPLALAVHAANTASTLAEMVFPHPMITEGINKAARQFRP
ncbi:MAG: dihydrolipoyl dehydrogenase [Acidiphilium sp.]|nr:dihydrolipoyl dehydrogenase [Acidiphilium sp.]MDD4934503.1 dihydrolipoyl dehydrogenase [Acidiphilium sp.]